MGLTYQYSKCNYIVYSAVFLEELREWYLKAGRKRWMVPEEVKKQDELVNEQVHLINSVFRFANKPFRSMFMPLI